MKILLIFFLTLSNFTLANSVCSVDESNCNFYKCRESENICGEKGYYLGTGLKFCKKFSDQRSKFSKKGKVWVEKVQICLQRKLDNISENTACDEIEEIAIEDHFECYLDSGYCELPPLDYLKIYQIILPKLGSIRYIYQGLYLNSICQRGR